MSRGEKYLSALLLWPVSAGLVEMVAFLCRTSPSCMSALEEWSPVDLQDTETNNLRTYYNERGGVGARS